MRCKSCSLGGARAECRARGELTRLRLRHFLCGFVASAALEGLAALSRAGLTLLDAPLS
jgi:hypothetical protein